MHLCYPDLTPDDKSVCSGRCSVCYRDTEPRCFVAAARPTPRRGSKERADVTGEWNMMDTWLTTWHPLHVSASALPSAITEAPTSRGGQRHDTVAVLTHVVAVDVRA